MLVKVYKEIFFMHALSYIKITSIKYMWSF